MIKEWLLTAQSAAKNSSPNPFSEDKPTEQGEEFSSSLFFKIYF